MKSRVVDRTEKLERIYHILSTAGDVTGPSSEASVVLFELPKENQVLRDPAMVGLRGLLGAAILLAAVFLLPGAETYITARMIALVSSVVVLGVMLREFVMADRLLAQTRRTAEEFTLALNDLRVRLDRYLVVLDNRTSRYFHCVTSTKVTTYCVLRQILTALEERLMLLRDALHSPRVAGLRHAVALLEADLAFRDGYAAGVGVQFAVPLHRLQATTDLIIKDLESGLVELEDEINLARRSARPPDTIERPA